MLEGFAHTVCVALHSDFPPHRGTELNRKPLGEVLPMARRHLPQDLQVFVDTAKKLGDWHHHNQGEAPESNPLTAQAMLLQCTALLQWLHREVLNTPPPPELIAAIHALQDRGAVPVSAVASSRPAVPPHALRGVALGLGLALFGAAVIAVWLFARSADPAASTSNDSGPFHNLDQPERRWIEAYQGALDARDPDRLVALHTIPTGRFFSGQSYDAPHLRRLFQGWFDHAGPTRRTGFDHCSLAHVGSDGARSLKCDTYIDPPLPGGGPSRVATCLAFNSDGKIVSRTEIAQFPSCPPP